MRSTAVAFIASTLLFGACSSDPDVKDSPNDSTTTNNAIASNNTTNGTVATTNGSTTSTNSSTTSTNSSTTSTNSMTTSTNSMTTSTNSMTNSTNSMTNNTTGMNPCQDSCDTLWTCSQETDGDGEPICPGYTPDSEDAVVAGCLANPQCSLIGLLLDPNDCEGSIMTLKGVSGEFKTTCEGQ